jgi:hypothetical protein
MTELIQDITYKEGGLDFYSDCFIEIQIDSSAETLFNEHMSKFDDAVYIIWGTGYSLPVTHEFTFPYKKYTAVVTRTMQYIDGKRHARPIALLIDVIISAYKSSDRVQHESNDGIGSLIARVREPFS